LNNAEPKNIEAWHELVSRIKELVLTAITSQIMQYEDDARRLEQQRLMPGWNYCQFFIMKEALSSTFEMMTLYEEALVHYDELEASFFQTLNEQGAPWFKKFGATEDGDDNPNIFRLTNKPYRDRIIQNSISIYDFRMYLFSRQCYLLNLLQRPIEICLRAKLFISSFSRTLHDYSASLIPYFRESWIYSLSLNVVEHCDVLITKCNYSNPSLFVNEGLKGELFLFARYQLDKLGVCGKLLSHSFHYDSPNARDEMDSFDITTPDELKIKTSNRSLSDTLKSKTEFDSAYEVQFLG
jgi:trafficking protein particle complex subunit 10